MHLTIGITVYRAAQRTDSVAGNVSADYVPPSSPCATFSEHSPAVGASSSATCPDSSFGDRDVISAVFRLCSRFFSGATRHACRHVGARWYRRSRERCTSRTRLHFCTITRRNHARKGWATSRCFWSGALGPGSSRCCRLSCSAPGHQGRCHPTRVSTGHEGVPQKLDPRARCCLGVCCDIGTYPSQARLTTGGVSTNHYDHHIRAKSGTRPAST
jgi:hypothetical protein